VTTSKLPARPSLESLRKQAKKLARGIDMTIVDYRWGSTAQGWAAYFKDEKMAQWLDEAQQRREQASR
jgi:hypothetical protein